MTIALFCILLAAIMPIVCAGLVKGRDMTVSFKDGGYDNRNPRDWIAKQQGAKKWAQAAQEKPPPSRASGASIGRLQRSQGGQVSSPAIGQ